MKFLIHRIYDAFLTIFSFCIPQKIAIEGIGRRIHQWRSLKDFSPDIALGAEDERSFEFLAPLFSSSAFEHGIIFMPVRQAAYLYHLVRKMNARKVIEIGRANGGSTYLLGYAMARDGELWSVDLYGRRDPEVRDAFQKMRPPFKGRLSLIVSDSRQASVAVQDVDVVLIDGGHSYSVAKSDYERFGRLLKKGGALLLDDAYNGPYLHANGARYIQLLLKEILASKEFKFVKRVDRIAHLERV